MTGRMIALLAAALACGVAVAQSTTAPPTGPAAHAPPAYQMRAADAGRNRLISKQNGAEAYSRHCGYCHLDFGMGTNLLTKQQVIAGNPPSMGLLSNRADLLADYVIAVVRNGKGAMPPQTRVDITDAELRAVAAYLAKGKAQ